MALDLLLDLLLNSTLRLGDLKREKEVVLQEISLIEDVEKDPSRRLSSAGEVADELDRWLRGEPLSICPVTAWERSVKWTKRNPLWAALVFALLLGGSVSLGLWQRAEHAVESLTATNTELNRSLVVAMATKLATNARLQAQEELQSCSLAGCRVGRDDPEGDRGGSW